MGLRPVKPRSHADQEYPALRTKPSDDPMCALRVTDPFDNEPAAAPVPQLPWPTRQRPAGDDDDTRATASANPPPGGERCWRRYRSTPARAAA